MDSLFRFILLRPAVMPDPKAVRILVGSFIEREGTFEQARSAADHFVLSERFLRGGEDLTYGALARELGRRLPTGTSARARFESW